MNQMKASLANAVNEWNEGADPTIGGSRPFWETLEMGPVDPINTADSPPVWEVANTTAPAVLPYEASPGK